MEPNFLLLHGVPLLARLIWSAELFEPLQVIRQDGLPHLESLLHPIALVPFQHFCFGVSVSFPLFRTYDAELHGQTEPDGSACPLALAPFMLKRIDIDACQLK